MTRMTQTSAVNRDSIIRALLGASRISGLKISHCCVDSRGWKVCETLTVSRPIDYGFKSRVPDILHSVSARRAATLTNFTCLTARVAQPVQRLATVWKVRESNPGSSEVFRNRSDRPQDPRVVGTRYFSGVKRPINALNHSPHSSAEVVNGLQLYLRLSTRTAQARNAVTFTFIFTFTHFLLSDTRINRDPYYRMLHENSTIHELVKKITQVS